LISITLDQSDGGLTGGTTWSEVYKARLQVEK